MKHIFVFFILSFIFFLNGCSYYNENPNMELTGNIIMPTPNLHFGGDDSFVGLLIFDVKNKQGEIVFKDKTFIDPSYDRNKILCLHHSQYLYEYDLNSSKSVLLLNEEELIHYPQYVPNINCISYTKLDKLIIYNLETKNKKEIDNVANYSWSKDGKSFIYNKYENGNGNEFIFKYDLENNTSIKLFEGRRPIYSDDNNYMAYFNSKDEDKYSEIIVRNLKTGEEKHSKYNAIHYFRFSPESDKIAYTKTSGIYESDLVVWDYKTDEHCVLIDGIVNDCGFDWK